MRRRRAVAVGALFTAVMLFIGLSPVMFQEFLEGTFSPLVEKILPVEPSEVSAGKLALLDALEVKGRAPKTGYARAEFGSGWAIVQGCSVREIILHRDLTDIAMKNECQVASGVLDDPYTGTVIQFSRDQASAVQIDHVVALSDAWQKGAQQLAYEERVAFANDPLNLIAADGPANQQKGDADAATWLPANKDFRCAYVERQVAVKYKYNIWVTAAEEAAMRKVLSSCN